MLQFHPPGMGQQIFETSLGRLVCYVPTDPLWLVGEQQPDQAPLLFLHSFGGGASAYEWAQVYSAFATTSRILAADLIGWGQSAHPARDYRVEDYLTTLAELLQQITPAPIVIASSLTGAIALRLATQHPQLFHSLFLVCPSGFADFGQDAGRRLPLQVIGLPLLDRAIYSLGATTDVSVRNFLTSFLFANPDRVTDEMVAAYLESARQPNAEYAALAFLKGDLYFDLARYLPQLTTPTAIVWGEAAQFTSVSLGKRLASLNPKAIQQFQVIPDAGVLAHLELPGVVAGLLQGWLRRVGI